MPESQYMTHDEVAREFKIPKTDADEFIGIYDITIMSKFEQPDISGSFTTVSNTIEFKVTVSPCIVTSFEATNSPIGTFTYTLGDPELNFGQYLFT